MQAESYAFPPSLTPDLLFPAASTSEKLIIRASLAHCCSPCLQPNVSQEEAMQDRAALSDRLWPPLVTILVRTRRCCPPLRFPALSPHPVSPAAPRKFIWRGTVLVRRRQVGAPRQRAMLAAVWPLAAWPRKDAGLLDRAWRPRTRSWSTRSALSPRLLEAFGNVGQTCPARASPAFPPPHQPLPIPDGLRYIVGNRRLAHARPSPSNLPVVLSPLPPSEAK